MNRKKSVSLFFCCFVVSVIFIPRIFEGLGTKSTSLQPFNEFIEVPENYRILDFDKWEDGMSRENLYSVKNSEICVTEEDVAIVTKITDILNQKKFTPILKEEFDTNYDDSNNKAKFWLSISVDLEASKKDFYPYNIFIHKDLSLYVVTEKSGDYRYLKSTLTEDEYKLIENSYNTLFEEKEMVNR